MAAYSCSAGYAVGNGAKVPKNSTRQDVKPEENNPMPSDTKWLPGPWKIDAAINPPAWLIQTEKGTLICEVPDGYTASDCILSDAHAKILRAAPEMYTLLDMIRDYLDRQNLAPFVFAQDGSQRCAPLNQVIVELLAIARGEQPHED